MRKRYIPHMLFYLMLSLALTLTGQADAAPQANSLEYAQGKVQSLRIKRSSLIVDDTNFTLQSNTEVLAKNGESVSWLSLRPGTHVRVNYHIENTSPHNVVRIVHSINILD